MLETIGAAVGGGLFGLLGTTLQFGMRLFELREGTRKELKLRELDIKATREEINLIAAKAAAAEVTTYQENFRVSMDHDTARYGTSIMGQIVDFLRGIVRPFITTISMAVLVGIGWLFYQMMQGYSAEVVADHVLQNFDKFMDAAIFVCVQTITWWFGNRQLYSGAGLIKLPA